MTDERDTFVDERLRERAAAVQRAPADLVEPVAGQQAGRRDQVRDELGVGVDAERADAARLVGIRRQRPIAAGEADAGVRLKPFQRCTNLSVVPLNKLCKN